VNRVIAHEYASTTVGGAYTTPAHVAGVTGTSDASPLTKPVARTEYRVITAAANFAFTQIATLSPPLNVPFGTSASYHPFPTDVITVPAPSKRLPPTLITGPHVELPPPSSRNRSPPELDSSPSFSIIAFTSNRYNEYVQSSL
jgi:hypothetical protein